MKGHKEVRAMLEGIIIGAVLSAGYFGAKKQLKKLESRVHPCRCAGGVCEI